MRKTMSGVLALILMSQTVAYAEPWRKTTADFYGDSYSAQQKEQMMGQSEARERAEAYRALYAY